MAPDRRARDLAAQAARLAAAAGVDLPDHLSLWALGGGRPRAGPTDDAGLAPQQAAAALVAEMEARLDTAERRQGVHYTPPTLAEAVVEAARLAPHHVVVDPSCGAGALLLAAGERLAAGGAASVAAVARSQLFGADIDPVAVAVAEAAIALWSGGTAPAPGHLVVADALLAGRGAWASAPSGGFDRVVGNPPFQGQLATATARSPEVRRALRSRFGPAVGAYVDTAALFLLTSVDLAANGGRVVLVQPQSTSAARDAAGVRAALAERATLVELLVPPGRPFAANVAVCIPVLEPGTPDPAGGDWARRLAVGRGVPDVGGLDRAGAGTVGDRAEVVAGFRHHYYALVDHVTEGEVEDEGEVEERSHPLVTSGLVDVGSCGWSRRGVRFAHRRWERPVVDVAGAGGADRAMAAWLDRVLRPKVVVASQTRIVEAATDRAGTWVPCPPTLSVVPSDPADLDRLAAAVCAPPLAAWAVVRHAGTGLSPAAIRVSPALLRTAPLPVDGDAWTEAAAALAEGALDRFAAAATAMYDLPAPIAAAVRRWWGGACGTGGR